MLSSDTDLSSVESSQPILMAPDSSSEDQNNPSKQARLTKDNEDVGVGTPRAPHGVSQAEASSPLRIEPAGSGKHVQVRHTVLSIHCNDSLCKRVIH